MNLILTLTIFTTCLVGTCLSDPAPKPAPTPIPEALANAIAEALAAPQTSGVSQTGGLNDLLSALGSFLYDVLMALFGQGLAVIIGKGNKDGGDAGGTNNCSACDKCGSGGCSCCLKTCMPMAYANYMKRYRNFG